MPTLHSHHSPDGAGMLTQSHTWRRKGQHYLSLATMVLGSLHNGRNVGRNSSAVLTGLFHSIVLPGVIMNGKQCLDGMPGVKEGEHNWIKERRAYCSGQCSVSKLGHMNIFNRFPITIMAQQCHQLGLIPHTWSVVLVGLAITHQTLIY